MKLTKQIIEFRKAYRECKELRSRFIKDNYDKQLLIPIIKKYKESPLYGKNEVSEESLIEFFGFVFNTCKHFDSNSSYKKSDRQKAVDHLKKVSKECMEILNKSRTTNSQIGDDKEKEILQSALKTKLTKKNNIPTIKCWDVIVINYEKEYGLLGFGGTLSLRFYIILEPIGLLCKPLNTYTFNFKEYKLDEKDYVDNQLKYRRIYEVNTLTAEIPFLGGFKIYVYMSPNDGLSSVVTNKLLTIEGKGVLEGKELDLEK